MPTAPEALVSNRRGFLRAAALAAPVAAVAASDSAAGALPLDPLSRPLSASVTLLRAEPDGGRRAGHGNAPAASGVALAGGRVLTNWHAVEGAASLAVRTSAGADLDARLIAADPMTDLAVLAVSDAGGLSPFPIDDVAPAAAGQPVFAIGSPLGLSGSVTSGVVSAVGRRYRDDDPVAYIQHDAALNRGASGGLLVDASGRFVGINTAIADHAFGFAGIAFATPAELVLAMLPRLLRHGHAARGMAGMTVQQLTPDLAEGLGRPDATGLIVTETETGGPASAAGLTPGDIIRRAAGREMAALADLSALLLFSNPGDRLALEVVRGSAEFGATLVLAARKMAASGLSVANGAAVDKPLVAFGAETVPADGGLRITSTHPDGAADRAGLMEGDVLLSAAGVAIATSEELDRVWRAHQHPVLALMVRRSAERARLVPVERHAPPADGGGISGNRTDSPLGTL